MNAGEIYPTASEFIFKNGFSIVILYIDKENNIKIKAKNEQFYEILDSLFINRENTEALKKAGLINIDNLIKLLMTDMIKKESQASVNIDRDRITQFDEKELIVKQFKEELKEKINKILVSKEDTILDFDELIEFYPLTIKEEILKLLE